MVANPLDNALIIQATPEQYQEVLRILKDLDVPPRQILLEAKIYSVDLSGSFSGGVSAQFQRRDRMRTAGLLGNLSTSAAGVAGAALQFGFLVGQSKQLLAFLNLSENQTRTTILSEPSLIATDSIPATLNVGTQVPVQTSSFDHGSRIDHRHQQHLRPEHRRHPAGECSRQSQRRCHLGDQPGG